jgi:SOS-response transcriptional repressor LexA
MIEQHKHELSERQMAILTFIHEYQIIHGFVPSIREIAEAIGTTSTSAVTYQAVPDKRQSRKMVNSQYAPKWFVRIAPLPPLLCSDIPLE